MHARLLTVASVAAVALAVLAAGCGDDGPSRRDVVAQYIEDVNTIEAGLAVPSRDVADASRELARPKGDRPAAVAKLRGAARTIDVLGGQLTALTPPEEAMRLQTLLLSLLRSEASLAREVAGFGSFIPAYERALQPLRAAGSKLKAALAAKSSVELKAEALDAYSATVGDVLERLRGLRPPPVSAPVYTTQVSTLTRVRASTTALAKALREQRASDLPELLRRFDRAAISNQSLAAQRARIRAVRAYNQRVRGVDDLIIRIHRERARLQRILA
jgi:hypothetical protein